MSQTGAWQKITEELNMPESGYQMTVFLYTNESNLGGHYTSGL